MRVLPRKIEGAIGVKLLRLGSRKMLQDAGLTKKSIDVETVNNETASTTTTMHYYERDGIEPPLLICHGLTDEAKNMAGFITALGLPNRVILPDAVGHGADLQRAKDDPASYTHPTPATFVHTTEALLAALNVKECHAFGYSMGGALVYFLKCRQPDLIRKTVLLSPSIEQCVGQEFLENFVERKKNYFCFETRNEVKVLMRDVSPPDAKKKNPVPKFFLQAIMNLREHDVPPDHFRDMMNTLLEGRGEMELFSCKQDCDPETERLVIWPDQDAICNHELGKAFFHESKATDFHTVSDCGHMFHSDGTMILERVTPMVRKYLAN